MINNIVKMVIWDLDDTFWKGTLTEGKINFVENNLHIVKSLVDRGIMCSVVSKNDYNEAKKVLKRCNMWDYFIFPHISWAPKGEQVRHLLEQCSLRAENVLFIDDNISNLREVEYYNKNIMTELPSILDQSFLSNKFLIGKPDLDHTRLNAYKLMEIRNKESNVCSSNEEFLRNSNITVSVHYDCIKHLERIVELVQRTNQLNYTKVRQNTQEIERLLLDKSFDCACISVEDKYGNYGVVGFYALRAGKLLHFIFSCRILGFGIENYFYKKLGYPAIDIVSPVTVELKIDDAEKVDWIEEKDIGCLDIKDDRDRKSILMIGGCDLEQICAYISSEYIIKKEFNTVVNGREIRTSDTSQILNAIELDEEEKNELCIKLPFFEAGITFNSDIFSGKYNTIVFSVVDDYIRGIWKNKKLGYEIGYGGYYDQDIFLEKLSDTEKKYLFDNFEFIGKQSIETFRNNLNQIISKIDSGIHIILINGIDLDVSEWIGIDRINRNLEMNGIVDEIVRMYENVDLLDVRTLVTSTNSLPNKDNRHFDRSTYYKMAFELAKMTKNNLKLGTKNFYLTVIKNQIMKILRKIMRG